MNGAERLRRQDLQRAGRLGARAQHRLLARLDVTEDALAEAQVGLALVGQGERAGRAVDQAHAEPRLEIADMARHQRARQAELARGDGERTRARDAHEALHGAETVHARIPRRGRLGAGSATMSCASSGFRAHMSKSRLAQKLSRARGSQPRRPEGERLPGAPPQARTGWFFAMTSSTPHAPRANDPADLGSVDRPVPAGVNAPGFGSDVVADALRATGIPYIALNPGASYRGLHDSIVNYLGNKTPQMLLCLHEETAVAIAHGYAKVTDKAMAAAVHSNVGLMHASMAMFNAWCDRLPVIVIGATGPVDAAKRRPWIDWIHTSRDQGALVRNYTKWDDQPASPAAAREAILRAGWIANTVPKGSVYVNLDAEVQEMILLVVLL